MTLKNLRRHLSPRSARRVPVYLTFQPFHGRLLRIWKFCAVITSHGQNSLQPQGIHSCISLVARRPRQYVLICRNYNAAFTIYDAKTHPDGRRIACSARTPASLLFTPSLPPVCTWHGNRSAEHKLILNNKMQNRMLHAAAGTSSPA